MKITHSFIVLTSIIFVTGSMLSVGMDLKSTTDNVSTNVIEAKQKYNEDKEMYLENAKKHEEKEASNTELEDNERAQAKAMYKIKLETLNQDNVGKNRFLPGKRIESKTSVD